MARHFLIRWKKIVFCVSRPRLWRALLTGAAPSSEHFCALRRLSFDTIVDVGANRGQFALLARTLWPRAKLFCFEPLKEPRNLMRRTLRDAQIVISEFALGKTNYQSHMYVTMQDDSSSLLSPSEIQAAVFSTKTKRIETGILIKRLDEVIDPSDLGPSTLLKIDVQGTELEVLEGAVNILNSIQNIYVECSYQELYAGQHLVSEVMEFLRSQKFQLIGVFNQYDCAERGSLQADFLFERGV
jgi:FkbM family methyltransferase